MKDSKIVRVLFVCLGNICRSPTAEGVFRGQVIRAGLDNRVEVDSCGTAGYHIGEPPDERAIEHARERGYDLSALRARQIAAGDFETFDYILAMDGSNLAHLKRMRPDSFSGHLGLFLDFLPDFPYTEVPDPYYGDADGFRDVLDLVEAAGEGLLGAIRGDAARH